MSPNAMTVDVEEYFQVEALARAVDRAEWPYLESRVVRTTERVLEMFARRDVKATFFTLGWVARNHPKLVKKIVAAGHELASHGDGHRMVNAMTRAEFREDVRTAKAALEDAGGVEVVGYRAPTFSIVESTLWALDELREAGYRYDSSVYPIRHDRYGIPNAPRAPYKIERGEGAGMVEFPMTTTRVAGKNVPAGGGGYLRLLPLEFNRWALRRAAAEGPFVVYFHPWEIDANQPRFGLKPLQSLRAYANLGQMASRLDALMAEFPFGTMRSVLESRGLLEARADAAAPQESTRASAAPRGAAAGRAASAA